MVNPKKPGKVRRVLNGASKFHGKSLNSCLLTGPDLLQDLLNVLLRFRQYQYAVSADIEGMFLQFGVPPPDQTCLRFLWREDPTHNVETLPYTRHIFGVRDSPTCANFTLQQTARDNEATYPLAEKAFQQKFYMDDYLDSVECPETVLKLSQELIEMLKLGGFKLTKFISNVNDLSETLEPSVPVPHVKEIVQHPTITSLVLGLKWDHKADTLTVSRGVKLKENQPNTQRTVLSTVSAVFDPLGIVAPFTVVARVLWKDIWKLKEQQWDDPLPEDLSRRFDYWCSGLSLLQDFATILRAYFSSPVKEIELHMFDDCSKEIFCAVGFLRAKCQGSNIAHLSFVVGKARVAPMNPITIPKLELQAALLAAHLCQKILGALTFGVPQSFMWTDSSTVLQWLASADKQPVFVANRVAEILETTTIDQWFHVPTANNPADAGTRGLAAAYLPSCCRVKGPNFLKTSDWPFEPEPSAIYTIKPTETCATDELQSNSLAAASLPNSPVIVWSNYSSYRKLIRIVAYLLRLSPRYRLFRSTNGKIEDPSELENAEKKLLYLSQVESFSNDLLADKGQKSGKLHLLSYSPFIGPDKLLRSQSRLRRLSDVGYDTKHPVVLDGKHPFVKLMLIHLHQMYHHLGFDYVRAQVGHKYIILKIRSILRTIRYQCIPCRKRDAVIVNPMMADLPKERLGYLEPPFSNCGVDYFGPFFVSIRRSSEKRWAFLFTCLTTRAIHLEIISSMDTSACVAGIERFIARRGMPNEIWSDNGTNFVGAEKELLEVTRRWNDYAPAALVCKGIRWKFNPPSAPQHGGSWERIVRSCKRVFFSILGNRRMTGETLNTTFCLVEQSPADAR